MRRKGSRGRHDRRGGPTGNGRLTGLALSGLLLVSCQGNGGDDTAGGQPSGSTAASTASQSASAAPEPSRSSPTPPAPDPTPSASPTFGKDAFAKGDCVASDPAATTSGGYRETSCDASDAIAKVLLREGFDTVRLDTCDKEAAEADLLIHLTRDDPKNYGKSLYAEVCLRNLAGPHPGAPGAGGGPNIVKGDCLLERKAYGSGSVKKGVFETACDGMGTAAPLYRVVAVVPLSIARTGPKGECPANTEFEFAKERTFVGDLYCAVTV